MMDLVKLTRIVEATESDFHTSKKWGKPCAVFETCDNGKIYYIQGYYIGGYVWLENGGAFWMFPQEGYAPAFDITEVTA